MSALRSVLLPLLGALQFQIAGAAEDPLDQWHESDVTGSLPNFTTCYGQGKWLELRDSSVVASTNRVHWETALVLGNDERPTDLAFANRLWVLAGARESTNLFVLTSADGVYWEPAALPPGDGFAQAPSIRHSPHEWVLLSSRILRSQDGRNWAASPIGPSHIASQLNTFPNSAIRLVDIVYGDGQWIAAANVDLDSIGYGALAVSNNLTDWQWWQGRALPSNSLFYSLKYHHGLFFGVIGSYWFGCSAGTSVVTSTDGANWISRSSPGPGRELNGPIALIDGRLVTMAASTSLCVVITPDPPPPVVFKLESDPLISLQQEGPGELIVRRAEGISVILEASEDLLRWNVLAHLPSGDSVQPYTDPARSNIKTRFYRVRTP
jgi:hypothetical protein